MFIQRNGLFHAISQFLIPSLKNVFFRWYPKTSSHSMDGKKKHKTGDYLLQIHVLVDEKVMVLVAVVDVVVLVAVDVDEVVRLVDEVLEVVLVVLAVVVELLVFVLEVLEV